MSHISTDMQESNEKMNKKTLGDNGWYTNNFTQFTCASVQCWDANVLLMWLWP